MSVQTHAATSAIRAGTTQYRYVIVDVFTETAFGGNQLAVFPDATGLSTEQMQKIAREFNFAESTFVIPATKLGGADRIRIFTPKREMPFAGHPTVGTAAVMSFLKLARSPDESGFVSYEEGIGSVSVRVAAPQGQKVFAELRLESPVERPEQVPVRSDLAAGLSLSELDILDAWYAAIGIRFCYVHLASQQAVDAAILDRQAWKDKLSGTWAPQIFLFSGPFESGATLYARMFAPALGVDEDPATGSASVALVGILAERVNSQEGVLGLQIHQGVSMGRPSAMRVFADRSSGKTRHLRLGGSSVIVAEGAMIIASDVRNSHEADTSVGNT